MAYHHPGTDLASAYELPFDVHSIEEPDKQYVEFDGVAIMSLEFKKAGHVALQHVHDYAHGTFVAYGSVRVFSRAGNRVYVTGEWIMIAAHTPHALVALEDDTFCWCTFNAERHPEIRLEE